MASTSHHDGTAWYSITKLVLAGKVELTREASCRCKLFDCPSKNLNPHQVGTVADKPDAHGEISP